MVIPSEAIGELLRSRPGGTISQDEQARYAVNHFVGALPQSGGEPDAWAVQVDPESGSELMLLAGLRVLVVRVKRHQEGPLEIESVSLPLDPQRVRVGFVPGEKRNNGLGVYGTPTNWTFSTEPELTVRGFIPDDDRYGEPDGAELLARGIAAAVGW